MAGFALSFLARLVTSAGARRRQRRPSARSSRASRRWRTSSSSVRSRTSSRHTTRSAARWTPPPAFEPDCQGHGPRSRYTRRLGALSSVGRAPARQAGGHWFEPSSAHRKPRRKRGFFVEPKPRRTRDFVAWVPAVVPRRPSLASSGRERNRQRTTGTVAGVHRPAQPWATRTDTRVARTWEQVVQSELGPEDRAKAEKMAPAVRAYLSGEIERDEYDRRLGAAIVAEP